MKKQPTSQALQKLGWDLMKKYTPLPEGKSGEFSVVNEPQKAGDQLLVVNFREAMFTGLPKTDLVIPEAFVVQKLKQGDGTWMSNLPCELIQMHREFAANARGNVLIGGLGLGIVADMVKQKKSVGRVTVVELEKDVVTLNQARLADGIHIINDDLFKVVQGTKVGEYDQAFYDIWQSDGEWTWLTVVVPLRRASVGKFKRIACWHEDVMKSQVVYGVFRAADIEAHTLRRKAHCHWYAFRKAAERLNIRPTARLKIDSDFKQIVQIEEENRNDGGLRWLAYVLVHEVGTPQWEKLFGEAWDEAWAQEAAA